MTPTPATPFEKLRSVLKGEVLLPGDGEYESARKIWNGTIDKRDRKSVV